MPLSLPVPSALPIMRRFASWSLLALSVTLAAHLVPAQVARAQAGAQTQAGTAITIGRRDSVVSSILKETRKLLVYTPPS
ncbi:MAG: hypothetical protein IT360_27250 [Gemmatimonadaceae bacterium]|nr:hypothetical protein [Gemmatimonadaceae bacterium]